MFSIVRDARTLYPHIRGRFLPPRPPRFVRWSTEVMDSQAGALRLTGHLREVSGASEIVVLIHGLGGSPESIACLLGAKALAEQGVSTLCLSLRGSDRRGEDFYNIALTADLAAAIASPELQAYEHIHLIGYSMGGYVALHMAKESPDPRLIAVSAICTPLSLHCAQRHIDDPSSVFFRRHALRGLVEIYLGVAKRKAVPTGPERVARVQTMHEWDRLTIAPRYGFESPEHYYEELSILPFLKQFRVPALLVGARRDPVVPPHCIEPFLPKETSQVGDKHRLTSRWVERAGHLAFSKRLDLGFGETLGLEAQALAFGRQSRRRATAAATIGE